MPNAPEPPPPTSPDPKPAAPPEFRDTPAKGFAEILPGVFRSTKEAE